MTLQKILNKVDNQQNNDNLKETNYMILKKNFKNSLVVDLHPHDVIFGRGEGINKHVGNILYRKLVEPRRNNFYSSEEKRKVAQEIINSIEDLNPPGRFLMISPVDCTSLYEVSHKKAITKVYQSLRNQNTGKRDLSKRCITRIDDNKQSNLKFDQHASSKESDGTITNLFSFQQEAKSVRKNHADLFLNQSVDNAKKQVIMPLSYIGHAFLETSDQLSDESKQIFRMLVNLPNHNYSGLLLLPGIIGSLCKHIDELERKNYKRS